MHRPTSWAARAFVQSLSRVAVLPARGFGTSAEEFAAWSEGRGRRRLLLEDFYRDARRRLDILMDGDEPAGGRWNFDDQNREPPPEGGLDVRDPARFTEDEIDEQVRRDLDCWEKASGAADRPGRSPRGPGHAGRGAPGTPFVH